MEKRITTTEYFSRAKSNRPAELVYGFVREAPTPYFGHQTVMGGLFRLLSAWYRKYGVRECWLVYEKERRIAIVDCASSGETTFAGTQMILSQVLPDLELTPDACFG